MKMYKISRLFGVVSLSFSAVGCGFHQQFVQHQEQKEKNEKTQVIWAAYNAYVADKGSFEALSNKIAAMEDHALQLQREARDRLVIGGDVSSHSICQESAKQSADIPDLVEKFTATYAYVSISSDKLLGVLKHPENWDFIQDINDERAWNSSQFDVDQVKIQNIKDAYSFVNALCVPNSGYGAFYRDLG